MSVSSHSATYRSGYWDVVYKVRDPHTENQAKKEEKPVDNQGSDSSKPDDDETVWIPSTFYDYYSDVELNGLNRAKAFSDHDKNNYNNSDGSSWNYATFRQFDQALSDYYEGKNYSGNTDGAVTYPLYTGHFQPTITGWGNPFTDIADSMGLYGYDDTNAFFSMNNSTKDMNGDGNDTDRKYDMASQGLVKNDLSDGIKAAGSSVDLPFFNKNFLLGKNSKNAVLGKVYDNVDFPFTRYDRDGNGIMYYGFDSARTTLHMENGYLRTTSQAQYMPATNQATLETQWKNFNTNHVPTGATDKTGTDVDAWSKNTDATGTVQGNAASSLNGVSNTYGFFPLNSTDFTGPSATQNNYGFGTKLSFTFRLGSDGNVTGTKNGVATTAPMCFTFSGDDDVWVFIDDKLVLDLGGDHGRVSGSINFSKNRQYHYTYSSYNSTSSPTTQLESDYLPASSTYVSKVKASPAVGTSTEYESGRTQSLTTSTGSISSSASAQTMSLRTLLGSTQAVNDLYSGEHTLTMYYMERGQWESNMKVEFNLVPKISLNVEKKFFYGDDEVTDWYPSDDAVIYAMVSRQESATSTPEVVALNEGASSSVDKYCLVLNKANKWKNSAENLDQYVNNDQSQGEYIYHIEEVKTDQSGKIVTDANGVPLAAKTGDTVYAGSQKYTAMDSTVDGDTTTLRNSADIKTSLSLIKKWKGTVSDYDAIPSSIRIKIQRAVSNPAEMLSDGNAGGDGSDSPSYEWFDEEGYLQVPANLPEDRWEDVTEKQLTISGNALTVSSNQWFDWKTGQGEKKTDTWKAVIKNLDICPPGGASEGRFYVYRIIEAKGSTVNDASSGSTKYGDNEYWVYYSGVQNEYASNSGAGVTVQRTLQEGNTYTYRVMSNWIKDTTADATYYVGPDLQITNTLVVHLPSTGARSALVITLLAILLMAGAGSLGLLGRKKQDIVCRR